MTTFPLTTECLTTECLDAIGFTRLNALVSRGYKPVFGSGPRDDGHIGIPFTHPRALRKTPPPAIMLWSDGIVSATSGVLWPEKYVPTEDGLPDWQKFILPNEIDRFDGFVASIDKPGFVDLYLKPAWIKARLFLLRLMYGSTLCIILGFASKLVIAEI